MSTSSIWSRVKSPWRTFWQHRYEYPEAHRQPKSNGGRDTASELTSSSVLDPEVLISNHPIHRTTGDKIKDGLWRAGQHVLWTTIHGVAMYAFWVYVKPRVVRYFYNEGIEDDDEDNKGGPRWRKRFSFHKKKRLCCCCDAMVSSQDNFCPKCGSPTCPLCVYCGKGIQNDDHYCKACGRPIPNQVIVDGGLASAPMARQSSASSNPNSPPPPEIQPQYIPISRQNIQPPPYVGDAQLPKHNEAEAESVPIVQADGLVPLVPAQYVEEVMAVAPPLEAEASQQIQPLQFATPSTQSPSQPADQNNTNQDQEQQSHEHGEWMDPQNSNEPVRKQQ